MPVKKGKVNEKVSTKVLAALSTAFGREISFVDDLTYSEYSTELREAVMRVHLDTGGEYADEETFKILSVERDRIRGKNTEKELETFDREPSAKEPSVNTKKTKISTSKFFDKKEKKPDVEGKGGAIVKIGNSVTSIVETLKEDQKQDKKQQGWFRKMVERVKRRKKENKLEFRAFDGLKKTATKLLAPMKSAWGQFLDFIGKVILGRVLFKILTWMGDKKNQGKLKSIIKFLKDWWPTMLAAYLLFGTGFTKMVAGIIKVVGWGIGQLAILIPKLIAAIAKIKGGKILKGLGNLLGGGKGKAFTGLFSMGAGAFSGGGLVKEIHYYNEGGQVPGSGNKDTVPAMLTPGEFVMSKGAVQKYGVNAMESMNAAAGGTNQPTLMGGFNEGGKVQTMSEKLGHTRGTVTDPKEKAQQEEYMLKFVNEERALQGLEPLTDLTYAPGVELTKMVGPGPKIKETSDSNIDLDRGITTTDKTKTRGDESISSIEMRQSTDEERKKFFAENPHAA